VAISIDRARSEHAPLLAAIAAEAMPGAWDVRSVAEEIAREQADVFIAVNETGAIAGFSVSWRIADEGSLLLIAVAPAQQRRGIGRRLLKEAERSGSLGGMRSMHLEVRATNGVARAFYAAHGYGEIAVRRAYYGDGEDAVLMRADLPRMEERHQDVTLVILAGGRGERMGGRLKALLVTPQNKTILETIIERLGPWVGAVVVTAPARLRALLDPRKELAFVHDVQDGPAAALIQTATETTSEWLLVTGSDQPNVSETLLHRLRATAQGAVDAAVVTRSGSGGLEPLWGLYRRSALLELSKEIGGGAPLKAVLERLDVAVIERGLLSAGELSSLEDADTLEEARAMNLEIAGVPCADLDAKG
jgi:ribosomal-protein-alanine N-acetyltransferase